jgi:hypothetical protein
MAIILSWISMGYPGIIAEFVGKIGRTIPPSGRRCGHLARPHTKRN